jgi:Outer membrane protein beta-barrel domain
MHQFYIQLFEKKPSTNVPFMKKTLYVVFCFCLIQGVSAQWRFGVKAGYNLSDISISGNNVASSSSSISGFNIGLLVKIPLCHHFSLQPELMYSGQGASLTDTSAQLRYNYINVPVLFKYQHGSGLFAETGPQLGFLVSANLTGSGKDADVTSSTQPSDFSWVFGIGYKVPKKRMGADLRYNLGISNIAGNENPATFKNSVFQFDLFYLF